MINQAVIARSKPRDIVDTGIIEDISIHISITGFQLEGVRISQTAYDLINEKLCSNTQRNIGIGTGGRVFDDQAVVPHLIRVQQDQTDGLTPALGHGIPGITAGSIYCGTPLHGMTGGTGTEISVRLNTVQRMLVIRDIVFLGEMPAQVFQISGFGAASTVGFVGNGQLTGQAGGIAAASIVKQRISGFCGCSHDCIIIGRTAELCRTGAENGIIGNNRIIFDNIILISRSFIRILCAFLCGNCGNRLIRLFLCIAVRDCSLPGFLRDGCFCRGLRCWRSALICRCVNRRHQAQHQHKYQQQGQKSFA